MKRAKTKIKRYVDGDFYVDLIDDGTSYEAWLTRKGDGVSSMMFGVPKSQQSFRDFKLIVIKNLVLYEYDL